MNSGPLNLGGADLSAGDFEAIDPGRYNAEVFAMEMDAVKNEGKLPVGTPMIKVTFRITDGDYEGRKLWKQMAIPPSDYDKKKAATMKGIIANFFIGLGDSQEDVTADGFSPDFDDYLGRECVVVVAKVPKKVNGEIVKGEFNNPVNGVKPKGSLTTTGASTPGLL
jgi:hypothetical protein